ncbi:MAG: hypothetical protein ABI451_00015 [Dokdonella sp.]
MIYALVWLAILALGMALVAAARGVPRSLVQWMVLAGEGAIVGMLAAGIVVGLSCGADSRNAVEHGLPWMFGLMAIVVLLAWRTRRASLVNSVGVAERSAGGPERHTRLIVCFVIALIALHLLPLLVELLLRPVFPWDAWAAWMIKPKAWYLGGHFDAFVDPATWITSADILRTTPAFRYPELSSWLQLLLADGYGEWNEPMVLVPWAVLFVGLLLAMYGLSRRLGSSTTVAVIACYALASMPLIDAHIALAGYLDLWIGAVILLSLGAWLEWRRQPQRRGLLVLAFALAWSLVLLKQEGAIWLLVLIAVGVYGQLGAVWQRRDLWFAASTLVLLVLMVLVFHGWINDRLAGIDVPGIGVLQLGWYPGGLTLITALFQHDDWHLLGLTLLLVPIVRWRNLCADREAQLLGLFLLAGWIALLLLFCFTPAAKWAESQTATNRLVMQLVPTMVLWLILLLRPSSLPSRV